MEQLKGPGYPTPLDAMKHGPKEEILYVSCSNPNPSETKTDFLATVDVDPNSPSYCKILHKTYTGYPNDQIHHFGWNVCSSCYGARNCKHAVRDKIIIPSLESKRIYIIDIGNNPKAPEIFKVIDASELSDLDCSYLHSTHCLPSGEIMISHLGDNEGNSKGNFVLLDSKTFEIKGTWSDRPFEYCYDFWYQPFHDIMAFSEFGGPNELRKGFNPARTEQYGRHLNLYSWKSKKHVQTIDLGEDGIIGITVRFLHNPKESQGYITGSLNSNMFRFYKKENGIWDAQKVISVKPKKVSGWDMDYMPGLITEFIISLDDKYMYLTNYLHGDVRQYDISDRQNPKLTGQVFLGGLILSDSKIKVIDDEELDSRPNPVIIKGKRLQGGPHRLQLSLDGKRLYATSGLYEPWDRQFYPDNFVHGGFLVKIHCDTENGGLKLDPDFYIEFNEDDGGPIFPHEIRYPGGDCSSDIWLVHE